MDPEATITVRHIGWEIVGDDGETLGNVGTKTEAQKLGRQKAREIADSSGYPVRLETQDVQGDLDELKIYKPRETE